MRKIEVSETQMQVLVAQYLREKGCYHALYTFQQESGCEVPLCSPQIDLFNSLFLSNQFSDCFNFLRHMAPSERLKRLTLKIRLLDTCLFSDEPGQAVGALVREEDQVLSQDEIQAFYALTGDALDHKTLQSLKLELFEEAQALLYPYYNQYVGSESVFQHIPARRLSEIVERYYAAQADVLGLPELQLKVDLYKDLAPLSGGKQVASPPSQPAQTRTVLKPAASSAPLEQSIQLEPVALPAPAKAKETHAEENQLQSNAIELLQLRQLATTTDAECLRLWNGRASLLRFTPDSCDTVRQFTGNGYGGVLLIQEGYFIAWAGKEVDLYDVHFPKPMKTVVLADKVVAATYDQSRNRVRVMHQSACSSLDLRTFNAQREQLKFQLMAQERLVAVLPDYLVTTARIWSAAGDVFINTGAVFGPDASYLGYKDQIIINGTSGLYVYDRGEASKVLSGRMKLLQIREAQQLIYGVNDDDQLVQLDLSQLRVRTATLPELQDTALKHVFLKGRLLLWLTDDGRFGFDRIQ